MSQSTGRSARRSAAVLLAAGALLRIGQYAFNRSLWLDEAMLALNIIGKSPRELFGKLDLAQVAPVGFLVLEKLAVSALGAGEYALRLFPLLLGLLALWLFWLALERYLSDVRARLMALCCFAFSAPLTYYASEAKPYSGDVLASCLALLLLDRLRRRRDSSSTLGFSSAGALLAWLSQPVTLLLAGGGCGVLALDLRRGRRRSLFTCLVCCAWLVSMLVAYRFTRGLVSRADLESLDSYWGWKGSFMPFPPRSWAQAAWPARALGDFMRMDVGIRPKLGLLYASLGAWALYQEDGERLWLLSSPFIAALAVSALRLYPFQGRLALFLVPNALILAAAGAAWVCRACGSRLGRWAALLALPLCAYPALGCIRDWPQVREEMKPVLRHIRERRRPEDLLILPPGVQPAFLYYAGRYGLMDMPLSRLPYDPQDCLAGLDRLGGQLGRSRAWLLTSRFSCRGLRVDQVFIARLDSLGARLDSFEAPGLSAHLFALKGFPRPAAP